MTILGGSNVSGERIPGGSGNKEESGTRVGVRPGRRDKLERTMRGEFPESLCIEQGVVLSCRFAEWMVRRTPCVLRLAVVVVVVVVILFYIAWQTGSSAQYYESDDNQ